MNILTYTGEKEASFIEKRNILFISIFFFTLIFLPLYFIGFTKSTFVLLVGIPFLLLIMLSFEVILFVFIALLFTPLQIAGLHLAMLMVYPLSVSLLINKKKLTVPSAMLLIPFGIYFLSVIPSLFNSTDIIRNIFLFQNLILIFGITFLLHNYIDDFDKIKKIFLYIFLFSFINAVYTAATGFITGERFWGFAGIVHVDYLNLLAFIFILISLITRGFKRILSISIASVFLMAIVVSQTRSMFLTLGITFLLLIVYLTFHSEKFNLKRIKIFGLLVVTVIIVAVVAFTAVKVNPKSFSRLDEFNVKSTNVQSEKEFVTSSLISRVLIWHTTYYAFKTHPYIGIGAYSFPFSSEHYHKLTPYLYKEFVEDLTPHQTHAAVLAETGVVGFAGFVIFLFFLVKLGLNNIKRSSSLIEKHYSLIILFSIIYVIISMFITDAWLWGQCGLLWGIIMGSLSGTNKILKLQK
jgi:O-antigen ligase